MKNLNYRLGARKRVLGIQKGTEVQPGDLITKARILSEKKDILPSMEPHKRISLMGG